MGRSRRICSWRKDGRNHDGCCACVPNHAVHANDDCFDEGDVRGSNVKHGLCDTVGNRRCEIQRCETMQLKVELLIREGRQLK